jgi:hypothetical protein
MILAQLHACCAAPQKRLHHVDDAISMGQRCAAVRASLLDYTFQRALFFLQHADVLVAGA